MAKASRKTALTKTPDDPLAAIFEAWRLWLLGALIGALLAWGLFQVAPPAYRARATVVVDNNLEEAWVYFPDRQLFQFLQRETERLEELAWSDDVMQAVAAKVDGIRVEELRAGILQLSQPSDGGWHFYADYIYPATAQTLAGAWAQAFVDAARAAVVASPELQASRAELNVEILGSAEPDAERIRALTQEIALLAEQTKGISVFTELYVSEGANLPIERSLSLSTYLLVGSVVGALFAPLLILLRPEATRKWQ